MNLGLPLRKLGHSFRENGVASTLTLIREYVWSSRQTKDLGFDSYFGVDTERIAPLWRLTIRSRNAKFGVRYQTAPANALREAIASLKEDPRSFTFVDLGCGKGRPLLVAAQLGFKHVIGIEFAEELVAIAKRNLAIVNVTNSTVIEGDAANFRFPTGDLVVFLYHPFEEEIMIRVIENLRQHVGGLYVVYQNARCAHLFDATTFLTRMDSPAPGIVIWRLRNK
jgi:SAM-dependent methyltransferase